MCEEFTPNFGDKKWMLPHYDAPSHNYFFNTEFVTKDNMTLVPHPPYSLDLASCCFSVSSSEDKTKRPPS
jgi:hypothetical protein